jgi:hypothetical protein
LVLELVVYSRRGCHLCELMLEELVPLCRDRATIRVLDVDGRKEWQQAFGSRVPVLCIADQEVCVAHLDRGALLSILAAAT